MVFGAILGAASAVLSFKGARDSAKSQKQAARANAEIAGMNAEFSRENEFDVVLQGRSLELEKYRQINRAIGSTRAAVAGAGLEVEDDPGTVSSDLVDDMRAVGAIDIMRIRENTRLERKKFAQQTRDFEMREKFGMQSARSISPTFAGLTAGLGAATSAYQGGLFDSFFPSGGN